MKKYIYPLAIAATLATTMSCSDEEVTDVQLVPDSQKELIQFAASDNKGVMSSSNSLTRAGFTGGTSQNLPTQIVARISSTDGTNTRHTRTLMTAQPDKDANDGKHWESVSDVNFSGDAYNRYWDDAFGRAAKLSVYAIAVPNQTGLTFGSSDLTFEKKLTEGSTSVSTVNTNWKTDTQDNTVTWKVTDGSNKAAQTKELIDAEDLCYSNNIQAKTDGGHDGRRVYDLEGKKYPSYEYKAPTTEGCHTDGTHDYYPTLEDGEMVFEYEDPSNTLKDGPGHFDYGHMIFKHALTRITIDLIGGDGFDYNKSVSFTIEAQNTGCPASVNLLKMNTSGTLNIQTGEWDPTKTTASDNTYMLCYSKNNSIAKDAIIYSLSAQVLPGYEIVKNETTKNMMTFMIDGNNYYVTQAQIFDALNTTANTTVNQEDGTQKVTVNGNKITLEQGKNYHFQIKVKKTGIQTLTCTLVDWVDVEGSFAATNAYITFESLTTDVKDCNLFDIYRVLNENQTVTSPTNLTFDGENQYMTGYTGDDEDKLSTVPANAETAAGVTVKTAGNTTDPKSSTIWQTTWFFENNKSFYHFRTVFPNTKIFSDEETPANGDYFTMYSGPINDNAGTQASVAELSTEVADGNYNDYHWGAIFKKDAGNLKYDPATGFDTQLTGPVGPTLSQLNLIEQHMMSNIKVVLLTPVDGDGNYTTESVTLFDAAVGAPRIVSEVNITNFSGTATVRMGNGLITPDASFISRKITTPDATVEVSTPTANPETDYCVSKSWVFANDTESPKKKYYKTQPYTYRVVPQPLVVKNASDEVTNRVGITIQTPDDNMYYVVEDLSKIKVSDVQGNSLKGDHVKGGYIDRWYPGYTYTYYFVITKTGIKALTCTIVDWVDVTADKFEINLES